MDILIKNMEMPKEGHFLEVVIDCTGETSAVCVSYRYSNIRKRFTKKRYKAIEIPEHGDLIDSKELFFKFNSEMRDIYGSAVNPFCIAVADAPTIVEASNGSDN